MRIESNVGMVKGNAKAHRYVDEIKFNVSSKNKFLEARNAKDVKWFLKF